MWGNVQLATAGGGGGRFGVRSGGVGGLPAPPAFSFFLKKEGAKKTFLLQKNIYLFFFFWGDISQGEGGGGGGGVFVCTSWTCCGMPSSCPIVLCQSCTLVFQEIQLMLLTRKSIIKVDK